MFLEWIRSTSAGDLSAKIISDFQHLWMENNARHIKVIIYREFLKVQKRRRSCTSEETIEHSFVLHHHNKELFIDRNSEYCVIRGARWVPKPIQTFRLSLRWRIYPNKRKITVRNLLLKMRESLNLKYYKSSEKKI